MIVKRLTICLDRFGDKAMAVDRTGETCRILREVADHIEKDGIPNIAQAYLRDRSGNTVGIVSVDFEAEE